jgi:signal transduction histidine kinase
VVANQGLADNKNQQLKLTIEKYLVVFADENKLSGIADNLFSNAIKFLPKKRIEIIVKENHKMIIFEAKYGSP